MYSVFCILYTITRTEVPTRGLRNSPCLLASCMRMMRARVVLAHQHFLVIRVMVRGARVHDIDLYHWSSTRFSRAWFDSLSVLVARGRAKVSVDAAASGWPKRIRDMQHIDHEDYAADYE